MAATDYFDEFEDPLAYDIEPDPIYKGEWRILKPRACKYCKMPDLYWNNCTGKWRLYTIRDDVPHICIAF